MTEYEKLMDILSHLPTERQEVIKGLASERARQYCDKYDNHLPGFIVSAYNYELSKGTDARSNHVKNRNILPKTEIYFRFRIRNRL